MFRKHIIMNVARNDIPRIFEKFRIKLYFLDGFLLYSASFDIFEVSYISKNVILRVILYISTPSGFLILSPAGLRRGNTSAP